MPWKTPILVYANLIGLRQGVIAPWNWSFNSVVQPYQNGARKKVDLHGVFILCARIDSNHLFH
jgi:hypothetical protein